MRARTAITQYHNKGYVPGKSSMCAADANTMYMVALAHPKVRESRLPQDEEETPSHMRRATCGTEDSVSIHAPLHPSSPCSNCMHPWTGDFGPAYARQASFHSLRGHVVSSLSGSSLGLLLSCVGPALGISGLALCCCYLRFQLCHLIVQALGRRRVGL